MKNREDIAKSVIKAADTLKTRRANADTTFQQISDYVLLNKGNFTRTTSSGERLDRRIFDSTAIQSNEQLASILHGGLTDPTTRWFNLRSKNEAINNLYPYKTWIEEVHKIMMSVFTRSESGFQQQNHETLLNLTGYGTGVMWVVDEKDKGISFSSRHLAEVYIEENSKGVVDTVYRKFKFTARQASQEWGMENIGEKLQRAIEKEPHKEFDFIHCVLPKEDYEREYGKAEGFAQRFNYMSIYVCEEDKKVIEISGFHEMPFLVPRWEKLVGEIYGRSPSWNALSDILMINLMSEVTIKAAQKQIDPPLLMADDGVLGSLQTFPGGINIGGVNDEGRPLIQPLVTNIRLDIGLDMMEQRRESIRSAYFVDQFMQRKGVQPLTATESNNIQENRLRLIGPQIRRIEDEYLSPLVNRVFNILSRKKKLPPLPDEVKIALAEQGMTELDLDIEYISPLAATQRSNQLLAYNRFFANAGAFIELDPTTLQNFDRDFIVRDAAELSGVPSKALKPTEAVAEERQQQAQQQQQQEMMGTIAGGAEVAANLSKAGIPLGGE